MIQRRVFGGDGCIGVAFFCFAVALVVGGGLYHICWLLVGEDYVRGKSERIISAPHDLAEG